MSHSATVGASPLFAFACRTSWAPQWGETIYNARTAGQAKVRHFWQVRDAWCDTKFTDIRCRKVGGPHTSERFKDNAKYRGMPDVRCGQRVRVGDHGDGVIVGHNASANFDVLFDTGRWAGQTLNCHPQSVELLTDDRRAS